MQETKITVVELPSRKPRKWAKRALQPKKRKKTMADLKREWLIQSNYPLRYRGLRGVYWYWLSKQVRKEEWEKWGGLCLTCEQPIESWEHGQCGHIVASSYCGEFLRFNRMNLTIQHSQCNNPRFSPHAGVYNAVNINKRMGEGYMENLLSLRKKTCKVPSQDEYRALIRALQSYQEAVKGLSPQR